MTDSRTDELTDNPSLKGKIEEIEEIEARARGREGLSGKERN